MSTKNKLRRSTRSTSKKTVKPVVQKVARKGRIAKAKVLDTDAKDRAVMESAKNVPPYKAREYQKDADRISKIDGVRFDALKTGIHTLDSPSIPKATRANYGKLWNRPELYHFREDYNRNDFRWAIIHRDEIEIYVMKRYKNENRSASFARGFLECLGHLCLSYDKKLFREEVRKYYYNGVIMQRAHEKEKSSSLMTESELKNFVCFTHYIRIREKLSEELKAIRAKNAKWPIIKNVEKNGPRINANLDHLLISVNTYIPPLRKQTPMMQFWDDPKTEPPSDLKDAGQKDNPLGGWTNYMWRRGAGDYAIVLNHDKIEGSRKTLQKDREIFPISDEIIGVKVGQVTDGKRLNEILEESFQEYPRKFMFPGKGILGGWDQDNALRRIFKDEVQNPTQNCFRRAYINYWHGKTNDSSVKKAIATRMRHTVKVADDTYRKENTPDCPDLEDMPTIAPNKPVIVPMRKDLPKLSAVLPKDSAKTYREKNKEKVAQARANYYATQAHRVLRTKVIWALNNNKIKKAQGSTIKMYGLVQDGNGDWYSKYDTGEKIGNIPPIRKRVKKVVAEVAEAVAEAPEPVTIRKSKRIANKK